MLRIFLGILLSCLALCPVAGAAPINRVVAVVNGDMITEFDLNRIVAPALLRAGLDPKNPAHKETVDKLRREVLQSQIRDLIVSQEAERLRVRVSEQDVDDEIKAFREGSHMTEEEFQSQLAAQKLSMDEFRANMRKAVLSRNLLRHMVARKIVITKEEIEDYYHAHPEMFSSGREAHVAILVYPPSANVADWAARLGKGKVDFADAVKEISVGPMKDAGGDLGFMAWADLSPELRERMASMKPGDISAPFELNGLQTQIQLLEMRDVGNANQSIDDVSEQIEMQLRQPRMKERFDEYMDQLYKRAVVDIRL